MDDAIKTAIARNESLTMTYRRADGTESTRVVVPRQILRYSGGRRVLRAFCSLRQELRHFRLDRVTALQLGSDAPF